ncbi:kinase-like domain-containing protein [Xylaria sp. FL1042]|nr:kinase-like domain-containing protein [Xylaria sp. FL1042]
MNSEPINAGPLTRLFTILVIKMRNQKYLRLLWKPSPGLTSMFNICIKVKPYENLAEAHAMQLVAQHTSVPVPNVYCAFIHNGDTYIVMSRIKGQMAWHGWKSRSQPSKTRILDQLRRMIVELRSVPAPEDASVGNVDGGPFCDCRLPSKLFWGPYATTRDFHEALASGANIDTEYENVPRESNHELVLTHGDLSSLNILVQEDKVVGIVDWETAGWFPSYWEYTCAKNVNPQNPFWADEVDRFLKPMPHELKMENIRRKYFGAF